MADHKMTAHERAVAGGKARAKAFNKDYQQKARAARSHESLSQCGRKGFYAAKDKGLLRKALQGISDYRHKCPSKEEKYTASLLILHKFDFASEVIIETDSGPQLVDFVVGEDIIEVNGRAHRPELELFNPAQQVVRQTKKVAALIGQGRRVCVLQYDEMDQWETQLLNFLQPIQVTQLSFIPF